jgi:large repetitive protein
MFTRMIRFIVLIATLAVAASMGASPIFCDRFDGEPCLDLPRILLTVPDLEIFESGELLIELEVPAPAGGLQVLLSSSDATILELPGSVTVSEFQSDLSVPISTDAAYGTVRITATGQHYRAAIIEVSITPPSLAFEMGPLVEVGHTLDGGIKLSRPASDGATTIMLSSSDPSLITISPAQVTIQEGEQSAPISITGVNSGLVELSATAPGYAEDTITVRSTRSIINVGAVPELVPGERRSLPISLSEPAPAGGLTILLESTDPAIATVEASIEIPEGRHIPNANPQVDGIAIGITEITARTDEAAPISRQVTVGKFQMTFTPDPVPIHVGWTVPMTVTLSKSAPDGGLEITLSNQDDTILTAPQSIFIPAGQTTANLEITALNAGSSALLAQANDTEDASVEVTVGHTPDITLDNFAVGKDLQGEHLVSLTVSPSDPIDLVVTVADPAIAVISPEPTTVGTASITFGGVSTTGAQNFFVQGLSQGATTITTSAAGFNNMQATLTVTDSGFYISSPTSISTTTLSGPTKITISPAQLNTDGSWLNDQVVRAGLAVNVPVTSADPTVGHISTSPVLFEGGNGASALTLFAPSAVGMTTVSVTQPTGFAEPTDRDQSIDAEVGAPFIILNDFAVGKDLQGLHFVNLAVRAPNPVDLVVTVADPTLAVISPQRNTQGEASITFSAVGNTNNRNFYVQGLNQGSTSITASAAGFNAIEATLTVTDSGFYFAMPDSFLTRTHSNWTSITIGAARLTANGWWSGNQEIRAGLTVEVPVASFDPVIGQITANPVVFEGGTGAINQTWFNPNAVGTTTVNMTQPNGFTAPIHWQSIDAEVWASNVQLGGAFTVGEDLQNQHIVTLSDSPPDPVDLFVSVADPTIALISPERTAVGQASINFSAVSNAGLQLFYVQGLIQGTTTLTASAEGFDDVEVPLTVTDSGFYIYHPSSISTTPLSSPTDIRISAAPLNPGSMSTSQEVRAGLTVEVPVVSSAPGVGHVTTSPVVFVGGTAYSKLTRFNPNTVGTTTVSLTQPTGFTVPSNRDESIDAEVRTPNIIFNDVDVGEDLQVQHSIGLAISPPDPVDLVITVADPAIAVISPDRMALGTASTTFNTVSNTNSRNFYVQGLSQGTTTLTASAAGFNDVDATLTVTDSGFYILWPRSISTTTYSNPTSITIRAARLKANGSWSSDQEVRAGLTVEIPVTSANPTVGQITTSPVVFEGGAGASKTTWFDPSTAGTTTVSMIQAAGFTAPTNGNQSINASVND